MKADPLLDWALVNSLEGTAAAGQFAFWLSASHSMRGKLDGRSPVHYRFRPPFAESGWVVAATIDWTTASKTSLGLDGCFPWSFCLWSQGCIAWKTRSRRLPRIGIVFQKENEEVAMCRQLSWLSAHLLLRLRSQDEFHLSELRSVSPFVSVSAFLNVLPCYWYFCRWPRLHHLFLPLPSSCLQECFRQAALGC